MVRQPIFKVLPGSEPDVNPAERFALFEQRQSVSIHTKPPARKKAILSDIGLWGGAHHECACHRNKNQKIKKASCTFNLGFNYCSIGWRARPVGRWYGGSVRIVEAVLLLQGDAGLLWKRESGKHDESNR